MYVGKVQYVDHHREEIPVGNSFYAVMHKRSSFEHERECRAVFSRYFADLPRVDGMVPDDVLRTFPLGINVPVDLAELIEQAVVSPLAPAWFADTCCRCVNPL